MLHQGNDYSDRLDPVLVCDNVLPASFFAVLLLLGLLSTFDASEAIFVEVCFVFAITKTIKMKSALKQIRNNLALCECATRLTNIVPRGSANNHTIKTCK